MTAEQPARHWASSTAWLVGANIVRNVAMLGLLLILAQLASSDVAGRFALALAIATPIFALAQFGLRNIYLTIRPRQTLPGFVAVQAGTGVAALAVSIAVSGAIDPALAVTVGLVALYRLTDNLNELFIGPLQEAGRYALVFWGFSLFAAIGTAGPAAVLVATGSLDAALMTMAGVSMLVTLLCFGMPAIRSASYSSTERHPTHYGAVLRAGLPSGVALFVLALITTLPQYFLSATGGDRSVGHFAAVLYLFAAAELFTGAVAQSWLPHARQLRDQGLVGRELVQYLARTSARWTAAYVPLTAIGILIASAVFPILFPDFPIRVGFVPPLVLTILLLPTLYFFTFAISVINAYGQNLTVGFSGALGSLAACGLLIPSYGLEGAFWAVSFAILIRTLTATVIVLRLLKREANAHSA